MATCAVKISSAAVASPWVPSSYIGSLVLQSLKLPRTYQLGGGGGGKRAKAEKEYKQFVQWGIGKQTIWTEVRGQAILGGEEFADKLVDHLRKHKDVPEIPKSQRYADRPGLDKIFSERVLKDRQKRDRKIAEAVERFGYTQRSIAKHLDMHYSYISQILSVFEQT